MLITPQISQVFTSIWLINNLIALPTSPNLPRIQKKHQNQASWLGRLAHQKTQNWVQQQALPSGPVHDAGRFPFAT